MKKSGGSDCPTRRLRMVWHRMRLHLRPNGKLSAIAGSAYHNLLEAERALCGNAAYDVELIRRYRQPDFRARATGLMHHAAVQIVNRVKVAVQTVDHQRSVFGSYRPGVGFEVFVGRVFFEDGNQSAVFFDGKPIGDLFRHLG